MITMDRSHSPGAKQFYKPEPVSHRELLPSLACRRAKEERPLSEARRLIEISLAETQRHSHIYQMVKDKEKSQTRDGIALRQWETEGGSLSSESQRRQHIGLGEQEQYVLFCLGGAVLMQWNELPTNIQRVLFERAASLSKEDQTLALREQIARFLHNHKDD